MIDKHIFLYLLGHLVPIRLEIEGTHTHAGVTLAESPAVISAHSHVEHEQHV